MSVTRWDITYMGNQCYTMAEAFTGDYVTYNDYEILMEEYKQQKQYITVMKDLIETLYRL